MVGELGEPAAKTVRGLDAGDALLELPSGSRVGRYELLEVLGQGGFGITYRARDIDLHRDVAIKEYLPGSFSFRRPDGTVVARSAQAAEIFAWGRDRFTEEARTLARLERVPGVVNVHDIVAANGTAYMVMEYVQGRTLEALLKSEGALDQRAIERILPLLLEGLERVHGAGFLHRDIKPANILIDPDGRPSLIDFGASRMALQGRTQALTAVYTPGYAAFEQFTSAEQGPPADIYALGATLYHAVAGKVPPPATDRMIEDRLVPAAIVGKGRYQTTLLAAIDAALRLKASDRPQTIRAWRDLLGITTTTPDRARVKGRRWPLWLGVLLIVAAMGAATPFAWKWLISDPQRAAADAAAAKAEADRAEAARVAATKAEADKAEAERVAAAKTEADKAEAERVAAAKATAAEKERIEREAGRKADQAAKRPTTAIWTMTVRLSSTSDPRCAATSNVRLELNGTSLTGSTSHGDTFRGTVETGGRFRTSYNRQTGTLHVEGNVERSPRTIVFWRTDPNCSWTGIF